MSTWQACGWSQHSYFYGGMLTFDLKAWSFSRGFRHKWLSYSPITFFRYLSPCTRHKRILISDWWQRSHASRWCPFCQFWLSDSAIWEIRSPKRASHESTSCLETLAMHEEEKLSSKPFGLTISHMGAGLPLKCNQCLDSHGHDIISHFF